MCGVMIWICDENPLNLFSDYDRFAVFVIVFFLVIVITVEWVRYTYDLETAIHKYRDFFHIADFNDSLQRYLSSVGNLR